MSSYRALLTVFLCIALVVMRIGSAHLHLCLDGQAPPASIQFGDDPIESGSGHAETGPAHQDYDYELAGGTFAKLPKLDLSLIALLFAFPLWLLTRRRVRASAPTEALPTQLSPFQHLRPPPCGPPLNSVV
jgi:hypothetical protein